LFVLKTNDNGEDDNRELKISFTNQPEQKAIYAQLAKSGGEVFREFVRDYLKETSPKKPCEVKGCDGTYNCPFSDNPTSDFCRNQCGEGVDE
ncbi:MAG: hypothetical protein IJI51_03575, partial [Lachnospiraceae bacterium]|nr:hypothetical protein [Lachnospiraceae bacterium]